MEIAALQAFIAVADTDSFSLAAEKLFITQPAVSKRIGALEAELGTVLFDRIGRRVHLTEAGRALQERARGILDQIEDTRRTIANLSGRIEGPLRFGTSHHIGLHRLPPVLRAYSLRYPEVELNIRFMDSEAICRAVETGDLEIGVVTLPPQTPAPLRAVAVWNDPLRVVASRDHPLAGAHGLTPADLAPFPAVLPARGTYTRDIVEHAFAETGVRPHVSLSTNYLETIKMLVSVGLGWSVLPRTMVDDDIAALDVEGLRPARTLGIIEHARRSLSNAALALKEVLAGHSRPEKRL